MQFEIEEAAICALMDVVDIVLLVCNAGRDSSIKKVPEVRFGRGAVGHLG